ncbi:hypothetical protein ACLOJK_002784 [Asimina triloba]
MVPQTSHLISRPIPSIIPSQPFKSISKPTHFAPSIKLKNPSSKCSHLPLRCSLSVAEAAPKQERLGQRSKPSPAEVSRTIMELSSVGTLSVLTDDGWPLGIGVQFVVDEQGGPVLCLNSSVQQLSTDQRSSLHVQLEQCASRTPQCTLQGSLIKPEDRLIMKKLHSLWAKKYREEVDEDHIYVVSVDRVLHMENFREDGIWVSPSEYLNASPDPLRHCAEKIVNEMNEKHKEDVVRLCNIYVDSEFQVTEAKMIWVDRLGFDVHVRSQKGVYEVRIPFQREVADEKVVKSSFNCMSQLAWEVEKSYTAPDFEKVEHLKEITGIGHWASI